MHRPWFVITVLLLGFAVPTRTLAQTNKEPQVTLQGRVIDPNGGAIEGARICLALSDEWYEITRGHGKRQDTPVTLGFTGVDGTFRVAAPRRDIDDTHTAYLQWA